MYYFNTLPKTLTYDENGNVILLTNLISRAKLIDDLRNNPMLFYEYAIQDGDTPEIVAEKYYGDPYRYWIVLLSNELLNPLWDWPLSEQSFLDYIDTKYATEAAEAGKTPFEYVLDTVYQYRKIVTSTNYDSGEIKTTIVSITETDYNSLTPSSTNYNFLNCNISITKEEVSLMDYERTQNEKKRQIKLLNNSFVGDFENTFKNIMGA